MKLDSTTYRLTDAGSFGRNAMIVGFIGLAATIAGFFTDADQFYYSYLTAFTFWTSLGLGALFFTMLHHLVSAEWSVVIRRLTESVMVTLPFMAIFFVPIILGAHDIYHWTHSDVVAADSVLTHKSPYLNMTFFIIRAVIYFAVWFILGRTLYSWSRRQDDTGDHSLNEKMRRLSAPGMVLFALTLTFAAFDWLMSLNPHWYSTIFGVYVFVGSLLAALSFFTLILLMLRKKGALADKVTVEHYHDLGKLLFAFTVFWTYIAFSQYFLIWYGNIPEETEFYHMRWVGSWKIISLLIVFGHFVLPFLALITRSAKRNLTWLKVMAIWMFFMQWVDLYWIILPNMGGHGEESAGFHLSWMDVTAWLGIGGVFIWLFWKRFTSAPIVPIRDRKLEKSFQFVNWN